MLHLDDDQLLEKLSWPAVLAALRSALAAKERYRIPARVAIPAPQGGNFLTMPCADEEGYFGVKQVAVLPGNRHRELPTVQAHYTLFSDFGTPALSCGATLLTRFRTSAVSALAAEALAAPHASHLLIIGTGSLAPWMAEAHLQTRAYERVTFWGRSAGRAEASAGALAERLAGLPVRPAIEIALQLEPAVREADVISMATTASEPVLRGDWLEPRQHLDLVGAFVPHMVEADSEAVRRSDVYVDDRTAALHEAGDLLQAAAQGWSFEQVTADIGEVLRGEAAPEGQAAGGAGMAAERSRPTLFKSVGLALEDLAVARLLLQGEGTNGNA